MKTTCHVLWTLTCIFVTVTCILFFGPRADFMCHCSGNRCTEQGSCPRTSYCTSGHFGPSCQIADITVDATAKFRRLIDDHENTCLNSSVTSAEIRWSRDHIFTWVRIKTSNPATMKTVQVTFSGGRPCRNQIRSLVTHNMFDIVCDPVMIKFLILRGQGVGDLCQVQISGGRNFALKQYAVSPSHYISQRFPGYASLAVDGDKNRTYEGGSCSHTADSEPEDAVLTITFTERRKINRIVIINRLKFKNLLDGFVLNGIDNGRKVFEYTESATSQDKYVITLMPKYMEQVQIRARETLVVCEIMVFGETKCPPNKHGLDCEHDCHCQLQETCQAATGACPSGCGPGYVGRRCIKKCGRGRYGLECRFRCSVNCKNSCHWVTGYCLGGCKTGYIGKTCNTSCEYGPSCNQKCPKNCANRVCDTTTGVCVKCNPGYQGPKCETQCVTGKFGDDCKEACPSVCLEQKCEPVHGGCLKCPPEYFGPKCDRDKDGKLRENKKLGRCEKCTNTSAHNSDDGCERGHTGEYCKKICPYGLFNVNCASKCAEECSLKLCHYEDGDCVAGCKPGLTGTYCDKVCDQGTYGKDCSKECPEECGGFLCDSVDGGCNACPNENFGPKCDKVIDDSLPKAKQTRECQFCLDPASDPPHICSPGYVGPMCDRECPPGFHDTNCKKKCSKGCKGNKCDHVTGACKKGCNPGYVAPTCEATCDPGLWGDNCANKCPSDCLEDTCDPHKGSCNQCPNGFFDAKCDKRVTSNLKKAPDAKDCKYCLGDSAVDGGILGCQPGYIGEKCEYECPVDKFGMNCREDCSPGCLSHECDHVTGECIGSCAPGFTGEACEQTCDPGFYGSGCKKVCSEKCVGGKCHVADGGCSKCKPGFYGAKCNKEIDDKLIEVETDEPCEHCTKKEGGQDPDDCPDCVGLATDAGDCKPGYVGENCEYMCPAGEYGTNCRRKCSRGCMEGECLHTTGACFRECKDGFKGERCDETCTARTYGPECAKSCPRICVNRRCNPEDGSCLECPRGTYGGDCKNAIDDTIPEVTTEIPCQHCSNRTVVGGAIGSETAYSGSGAGLDLGPCLSGYIGDGCNRKCPQGLFGSGCTQRCSPQCSSASCDIQTGACTAGCVSGYRGVACDEYCEDGSYDKACAKDCPDICAWESCDVVTGSCTKCKPGFYGALCDQPTDTLETIEGGRPCEHCVEVSKETASVKSTGICEPGYTGTTCEKKCPFGLHGSNCGKSCNTGCKNHACDHESGICEEGCIAGHLGKYCTTECDSGFFGDDCSESCPEVCQDNACETTSGACLRCTEGMFGPACAQEIDEDIEEVTTELPCQFCADPTLAGVNGQKLGKCVAGYIGKKCNKRCPNGSFGINCIKACSKRCKGRDCHQSTGSCLDGCLDGFRGQACENVCPRGMYGANCAFKCSDDCRDEACDTQYGRCTQCAAEFFGARCDQAINDDLEKVETDRPCQYCIDQDTLGPQDRDVGYCEPGYIGALCDFKCPVGLHGTNCKDVCNIFCNGNLCHHVTGECMEGCAAGRMGEQCEEECPSNKYGIDCRSNCSQYCITNNNTLTSCDVVTGRCLLGCMEGYGPPECYDAGGIAGDQDSGYSKFSVMLGWILTLLLVGILICVAVLFLGVKEDSDEPEGERNNRKSILSFAYDE